MLRIGIVGIGNMGGNIAARLLERGWPVSVRDLDPHRERQAQALGAQVCNTSAALAQACDCLLVCVVDAGQAEHVLFGSDGAAARMAAGRCVMLCPTIAPADTERIASRLAEHGIDSIDAPMSGGPARARDGSMSLMLACADAVFERHRDLIETMSQKVFRLGARIGDGARTKLVNNLLAAINLVGAAEAIVLAQRIGLDPGRTLDVIEQSSGQSWIGSDRMRRAIVGDLAPRAHTRLLDKDTHLALAMAQSAGLSPSLGGTAARAFAEACAAGFDALDDASLVEWLRRQGH